MSGYEGGVQERFEEFLRTYKDEQGNLSYWTKIQRFSIDEALSLIIDFQNLMTFDNVVFTTLAKDNPLQFLEILDSVLRSVLRTEDPDYVDSIDEGLVRVRIINYPNYVSLRSLRSRHIGTIISISGVMMRASEVKPLLIDATFKCRRCGELLYQSQEDGRYVEPDQCTVCGKKTPVRLIPEKSTFRDWQKVRIQESPEELPPGQMPRSVDVILEGDIVDVSRPGDLVKITGILLTTPDFSRRGGRLATFNVYINANGAEIGEKEYEQIELTEEDEKEIRKTSEDPYVHQRIFASIAPSIHGHENIKESIALLLFGGVGKTLPDGTRLRGRSNILMIGDPGTGKSVHGDEKIYLRSSEEEPQAWGRKKISEVVDTLMSRYPGEIKAETDTEVFSLPEELELYTKSINLETLKTESARIVEVSRHRATRTVKIYTESGRVAIMTPDHSLSSLVDGHLQVLTASNLSSGTYIPVARNIDLSDGQEYHEVDLGASFPEDELVQSDAINSQILLLQRNETSVSLAAIESNITPTTMRWYENNPVSVPDGEWARRKMDTSWFPQKLPLDESLGRVIGFYLSEGNTERTMVRFTNFDGEIKKCLADDLRNVFGKASVFERGVYICQSSVREWFLSTFNTGAADKNLPAKFMTAPLAFRCALLSAYFSGDGWVEEKSASVNAVTKSRELAYQISALLSTLGILSSIKNKTLKTGPYKGQRYYRIVITGEELFEFNRQIGFISSVKRARLERLLTVLLARRRYQSHDIVPNFGKLCVQAANDLKIRSIRGTPARKLMGEIRGKTYRQRVGRKYLHQLLYRMTQMGPEGVHSESLESLRKLAESDIYWDKVTRVEQMDEEMIVYDIGTENGHFILANGNLIVHNSQILKFVSKLVARSIYTSGKGTSAAGLTAAVMHDAESGSMTLEAGALVLADQGIACIDEFDKMDPNDRTAIHEAMEQHTVSIAKAGIVATLNARTSILAAANPTLGRYESSLSVQDNIKLPFTILSRFDLLWILVDTVNAEKDRELAQFILGMHRMQKTPESPTVPPMSPDFLKKYIGYANRYVIPQLTPEASEEIENFYVNLRKSAEGGAAPVPITARQLESLVRLSEARAKMALRSRVTKEDAQAAIRLMEESLRMVALDQVTGKIDIDRVVSTMSASQRSSSDIILKAMKDMESEGSSVINEEELITRVGAMGLSRERAEEVIKKLLSEGILFNPTLGKLKRAQS
jgi:replicative DNA helicase Mcm